MNAFLTSDVTGQRVNFCFCALWHWKSRLCFRVEWKIDDRLESNSFNNFLSLLHLTFQSLCDLINSLFPKSNSFSFTFSQTSHLETPSTSRSFHHLFLCSVKLLLHPYPRSVRYRPSLWHQISFRWLLEALYHTLLWSNAVAPWHLTAVVCLSVIPATRREIFIRR